MAYTTIKKPSDYFNTKLYTGNGGTNAQTGVGFQPDFTWIKSRSQSANHYLYDAVRGVENKISSNTTAGEIDMGTSGLNTFGTDGFTVGNDTDENASGQTYASWNWLGANGTAANTDGTISSTVSANTTSGFSIVKYTGTGSAGTVGHGLGSTPKMIIVKTISASGNYWTIYHQAMGNTNYIFFNTNGTASTADTWNDTSPTSSVFHLGTDGDVNTNGATLIAYCFADVQGYSKFSSYVGNGNADGSFVYTGFKPAWLMIKRTDGVNNWIMLNNKMSLYNNNTGDELYADQSAAQNSFVDGGADFLSNGFKLRGTNASVNFNGGSYIYMAFAEQPLVGDNPATAR